MEILKERYSITELSEMLGISDHSLRFYEKELELQIPKDERGRRYYNTDTANMMYKVKLMRSEGLEIKAIKKILHDDCIVQTPNLLSPQRSMALSSPESKEYEAIRVFFNEFVQHLTKEISSELMTTSDHLTREITKSKLELGACVENGMRKLESKLDRHFVEVDKALGNWREKNRKKSFKRIFPLFIKK